MKKVILVVGILVVFVVAARAQFTVPFSGNNSYTVCSGTIQDHAGSSNYSNGANGYTVISFRGANL